MRLLVVKSIPAGWIYPGLRLAYPFNGRVHRYVEDEGIELIHYHTPLFLGRLALVEERPEVASKMFSRAIQLDPDCLEALRELRLINMRREKSKSLVRRILRR